VSLRSSLADAFRRPSGGIDASLAEPTPPRGEVGDTGHAYAASYGSRALARRLRVLEYNYELYDSLGVTVYNRMRYSDPKVAGLLRAIRLPILGAQVRIEPVDPDDAHAVEVADFVSDNLLHGLADGWRSTLYQFLLYLCHGFACFEMVWKLADGHALIDRFGYRPPETIGSGDIYVIDGRIDHVHQSTQTGVSVDIPGEKLVWFAHEREGDNWRGTSLLRPMFKPWWSKEKLEILLLIAAERMNGVPVAIAPPGGWGVDASGDSLASTVDAALAAFCQSETGYFDFPDGTTFQLVTGGASLSELRELRNAFDQDMSNVAIAQVLDLGKTETGSRALGRSLGDMFADSLTAVATDIEDTLNAPGGPIEQLVAYNFAGADELTPRLRFGSISKLDLRTFAAGLYQCSQMGMPFGPETWEWIRAELDLPALTEDAPSATAPQEGSAPVAPAATPDEASPPAQPPEPPADGAEPTTTDEHVHLAESGRYWRALTPLEHYVALDEIAAVMDDAKAAVREGTQAVRDKLSAELVKRAQVAMATGDPAKVSAFAAAKPPMVDALAADLRRIFRDAFDAGRAQVADEIDRQRSGEPVIATELANRRRGKPTDSTPDDLLAWIDEQAQVSAREIAATTQASAARQAMAGLLTGIVADRMLEMVTRDSDEAALRGGLTVSKVMVAGRSAEARAEREAIKTAVYSAILDGNTCGACEEMDGRETDDIDESLAWAPNPECDGGDRCRCLVIFEFQEG